MKFELQKIKDKALNILYNNVSMVPTACLCSGKKKSGACFSASFKNINVL